MNFTFLLLIVLQQPGDTLTMTIEEALERGLESSALLTASRLSAESASSDAGQAHAWPNPILGISAENVGQQQAFTGIEGREGLEGQAVFTVPLPIGWERAGQVQTARARALQASSAADVALLDITAGLLTEVGAFLRDQGHVESAEAELATLTRTAEALRLQAEAGRASLGDAARAGLARGMAATALARREVVLAKRSVELARRTGLAPDTPIRIQAPLCGPAGAPPEPAEPGSDPPELRFAEAGVDAARGMIKTARGLQLPNFQPQVGLRRSGGETGLYVGIATPLPFFDRGSRRLAGARADEGAALAQQRDVSERWVAAHAGASRALRALERAGAGFDAGWFTNADQAVRAAEARFAMGEGTLFELLDSRRARLQALDDYRTWQAEWWTARVELARLEGRPMAASLICTDPYRGGL